MVQLTVAGKWYNSNWEKFEGLMNLKLYIGLLLLVLVVIFSIQNVEIVKIKFLFWELAISRALIIIVVFSLGILIGWLLSV